MSGDISARNTWVVFRLQEQCYAISAQHTREMLVVPQVTSVPRAPDFVRGVINLRGQVLTLLDLRRRLQLRPFCEETEELLETLRLREQDHRNWLTELESSVREGREFRLTTNPEACAFGKWYKDFRTRNLVLGGILPRFDKPHRQIHAIGVEVGKLMQAERAEEALTLIAQTRNNDLATMIHLFAEAAKALRQTNKEIALVVEHEGMAMALTVDEVESVDYLPPDSFADLTGVGFSDDTGLLAKSSRRQEDDGLVLILNLPVLVTQTREVASAP